MKKLLFSISIIFLTASLCVGAQELIDGSGMFDNPAMVKEEIIEEMPPSMDSLFLESDKVVIRGQFSLDGGIDWRKASADNLQYSAKLRLTLDARPDKNYRAYAKIDSFYPTISESETASPMSFDPSLSVKELYADTNWGDTLYLRAGKQTIAWGVGRYFSPADVLNLTAIDIEDPDAERYGPVALKINIPEKLNNFYGYVIANDISSANDLAYAVKAEFLVGETEFAIAGFYRQGMAPRAIAMVTFPVGAMDFYAEAVAALGSDKTFLDGIGGTYIDKTSLIFQATAGFSYKYTDPLENWNISATGQFWYNGEGYEDPAIARISKTDPLMTSHTILPGDLLHPDRYYAVASLGLSDIYKSGFNISALWFGALGGETGKITPIISHSSEDLTVSFKAPINYGPVKAEYAPFGCMVTPTVELKLLGTTISAGVPLSSNVAWDLPLVITFGFSKAVF